MSLSRKDSPHIEGGFGSDSLAKLRSLVGSAVSDDLSKAHRLKLAAHLRKLAAEYEQSAKLPDSAEMRDARKSREGPNSRDAGAAAGSLTSLDGEGGSPAQKIKRSDSKRDSIRSLNPYEKDDGAAPLGWCMTDPRDGKRMSWDFLAIMPSLAYLTIMMPFRMCFVNEAKGTMWAVETTMDFIFIFDIGVNFRTAYVDEGTGLLVTNSWLVAKNYGKSWFPLDVVSGIPFGLLDMPALSKLSALKVLKGSRVLKAFKLLRFLKLSRLIKQTKILGNLDPEIVDRIEDFMADGMTKTFLRILRIILIMAAVCHQMACVWTFAGRSADLNGEDSWLANDFKSYTAEDTKGGPDVADIYIAAYYFCFTTMTTVGYGDVTPYSSTERVVAVALQLCGGFVCAWVIASLTSIVTEEDANSEVTHARLDAVASYIDKMQVPEDLGRRIRRHFRHFFENKSSLDESVILMEMSTSLREELTGFLVQGGPMKKVSLFKSMSSAYWVRVIPILRPCLYGRDEVVCSQNDEVTEALIVLEGSLTACTVEAPAPYSVSERKLSQLLAKQALCGDGIFGGDDQAQGQAGHKPFYLSGGEPAADERIAKFHQAVSAVLASGSEVPTSEIIAALAKEHQGVEEPVVSRDSVDLLDYETELSSRLHMRVLSPGGMVHEASLLKLWPRAIERVQCVEKTDCYAISTDKFLDELSGEESVLTAMREHLTRTSLKMKPPEEGQVEPPTKYGVPLFAFDDETVAAKTAEYKLYQAKRKEVNDRAKARALRESGVLVNGGMANSNTGSRASRALSQQ